MILKNIYFEFDKATLLPSSHNELGKLVDLMLDNKSLIIEIGGHTDNVGNESYNLTLSNERALSVKNYLIEKGVEPLRVQHKGYGKSKPITNNDNDEGRQINRRVEFVIMEL